MSDGGPSNTYQWQVNGSDFEGEISPILPLPNLQASMGGTYTCVVSNAAGSDADSTFVYVAPYFITEPVDTLTSDGTTDALICEAEAFPSPDYQWGRVDGLSLRAGLTTDTGVLGFNPVMFGDEGQYFCNVSSLNITITSQAVTLTGKVMVIST